MKSETSSPPFGRLKEKALQAQAQKSTRLELMYQYLMLPQETEARAFLMRNATIGSRKSYKSKWLPGPGIELTELFF